MQQTVNLGAASTELLLGAGCRHRFLELVQQSSSNLLVMSDQRVEEAVRPRFLTDHTWLTVPSGEESKSLEQVGRLWSELVKRGVDRSSGLVAVGGGVVCDLAGFVASTYLRGIAFYALPTSLLAMVDASVGGKVGIDLPEGKNLVGQFYPGQVVACDPELLSTLPHIEWSYGMAEVIKHGILSGPDLWSQILSFQPTSRQDPAHLDSVLSAAVQVKVDVVKDDPYEKTGLRATLNLGHSYGHAIEWCSHFTMGHGAAVGLGLLAGLRLSRELGILEEDFENELVALLQAWDLPTTLPPHQEGQYSWENISTALGRDKKNKDGRWCFVLPKKLGRVETVFGPPENLVERAFRSLQPQEVAS
ncbi:MAG TPA: 3-dehydroquinate synthase [Phycisphaerales bacterium]|nr:3-dehydroquinate synthase [Phycisphaerales bacterium]